MDGEFVGDLVFDGLTVSAPILAWPTTSLRHCRRMSDGLMIILQS